MAKEHRCSILTLNIHFKSNKLHFTSDCLKIKMNNLFNLFYPLFMAFKHFNISILSNKYCIHIGDVYCGLWYILLSLRLFYKSSLMNSNSKFYSKIFPGLIDLNSLLVLSIRCLSIVVLRISKGTMPVILWVGVRRLEIMISIIFLETSL